MAEKTDWRTSGMIARRKASLPIRGERTRKGLSWRRILSPVSFLLFLGIFGILGNQAHAEDAELLAGPTAELQTLYEMDELRVEWKISAGLSRALRGLGPIAWEWTESLPANCPDRVILRATGSGEDTTGKYLVSGSVLTRRSAFQATRSIRVGSLLLATDIELKDAWVPPSAMTAQTEDELVGLYVRSTVMRGHFLAQGDIRERPLVQKGSDVRVEFRGEGLLVTGRATSRQDAWLGESVQVRVVGASKDCRALVQGPRLVVVDRRSH